MNSIPRNLHSLLRLLSQGTNALGYQYLHQQSLPDAMANPLPNDDEFVSSLKRQIEHKIQLLEECASGAAQETMYSVVNEPVEIKKQVLSLLETASLCAPSPEMQHFKESMKVKVHLASGKALQCLNTRIECDEGVVAVSFIPAKPAEVVLGTPSPAENTRQHEDERSRRLDEPGDEERQSEMSVDPSSSSEPELQDSGDEPLIPRGREKTYQTKRPAASSGRSPDKNSSKRQRVTPEESRLLTVLEKDQVGEKEYTFELPYRSNRIWVLRCPVCPDFQFKTNCLAYPYNLTKHCKFTDKGGEDTEKRHRRFVKRFKNNSAYLLKNCIFEGTSPSQHFPAAGSLTQIAVMGADFDWAVKHNAQGGRKFSVTSIYIPSHPN